MTEYTEEIKRIKAFAHSAGLRIEKLKQQNAELLEALKEAKSTLEFHLSKSQPQQYCDQSDFFNSTANSISNIESLINKYTQS